MGLLLVVGLQTCAISLLCVSYIFGN